MTRSRLHLPPPATRPISRRRFLGSGAVAAGGLMLGGPALLAACGNGDDDTPLAPPEGATNGATNGAAVATTIRWSNWPLYIDPVEDLEEGDTTTLQDFEAATGISVNYTEDVQDNDLYFAKIREPLSRGQDPGADVFIVTDDPMVSRLAGLGWLQEINYDNMPNVSANLLDQWRDSPADPGRRYSVPYFGGFIGLAYNTRLVGRPITTAQDLFDPEFAGQVTLFSSAVESLGQFLLLLGYDPATVTVEQVQEAADLVAEAKAAGQIRQFLGNDYVSDLERGNIAVCQAYSGDVAQIQYNNPDIEFVVPDEGMIGFIDSWCIPTTTPPETVAAVEQLINFYYDPVPNAKLTNYVQFISPVSTVGPELEKLDPEVAGNPLINPPAEYQEKTYNWRVLTEEEDAEFNRIFTAVVES